MGPEPHFKAGNRGPEREERGRGTAKAQHVGRTQITRPTLGIHLMRKGFGALHAQRHRCADCGRTPLIGERVYAFAAAKTVCELCRPLRREEPAGSELVRGGEHGATVRIRARAR